MNEQRVQMSQAPVNTGAAPRATTGRTRVLPITFGTVTTIGIPTRHRRPPID